MPRFSLIVQLTLAAALLAGLFVMVVDASVFNAISWRVTRLNPTDQDVEVVLHRVGFTPENLTAAGLSTTDAEDLVAAVRTELEQGDFTALVAADQTIAARRAELAPLEQVVRAGQATQQQLADVQTARTDFANAESTLASVLDGIRTAGLNTMTEGQSSTMQTIIGNLDWTLPAAYLVVDRDEEDWIDLRNALATERINTAKSIAVDAEVQTLLSQVRAGGAVSSALSQVATNLSAVATAFTDAIYTEE